MKTRSKAADFLVPRSNFIYSCQVFDMYVWESEAEEQIRSLFLHCVNIFRWSQCDGFRELWKLKIVCNTATQGVGLVSIQAGWNHQWQLMFMSCLRFPLISWETVPKTIGWPLAAYNSGRSVFCVRSCTQEVNKQPAGTSSAFYTHPLHSSLVCIQFGVHNHIMYTWPSSVEKSLWEESKRYRWSLPPWGLRLPAICLGDIGRLTLWSSQPGEAAGCSSG